ncbi:MAG: outer membrane beta-barrel protein, partial [Pseudomonadota bacterium]
MTSKKTLRLLSLAGLGTLLATSAFAQDHSYYYGGVGIGQSRANIDNDSIKNSQLPTGLSTTGITREDRDAAYKLFGGYQFNQNFALEAGYFNLGKFSFASTTFPAGTVDGQIKVQGVNLDLVGTLPMTERFSLLGRVGVQHAKTSDTFRGTGAAIGVNSSPSKRDTNYKVGAGMQYEISPAFLVRGEVERFRINDAVGSHTGVNMLSVSLVFPFGREEAPRKVALAPVYVAPEPEVVPPPAVVTPAPVVAAPVVPQRVTFSADSLFTFNQSAVGPDGKVALD